MASKSFFNSHEISEAILAAAKSNKSMRQQNELLGAAEAEEHENNFLHRLHQNSQLLSCDAPFKNEEENVEMPPPPFSPKFQIIEENNGKNCEKSEGEFLLEISTKSIDKLIALFGDKNAENKEEEDLKENSPHSIELSLPLWLGELLYRASQGQPLHSVGWMMDWAAMSTGGEDVDSDSQIEGGQKAVRKKKGFRQQNERSNSSSSNLDSLFQAFPNIPAKTIKQCVKENNYDYNQTAEHLLNNVEADELSQFEIEDSRNGRIGGVQGAYSTAASHIVPSHCPRVISELEQQRETASPPAAPLMPEYLFQRVEEIDQMAIDLARIEEQRKFCDQMAKANSSGRDGAIRSYYARKARDLVLEKRWLESQCDRIRAWNSHNDFFVDLHDMGADRAMELVKFKIDLCREKHPNYRKLHAITGYGKTTGQPSVIRGRLIQFLRQKGIDFSHLNRICGHRLVPVELGSKYTDEDWHQQLMTFNRYLAEYVFPNKSNWENGEEEPSTLTKPRGYLAQHRLLDQVPELLADLPIPDYCAFGQNEKFEEESGEEEFTFNMFIGPAGTVSPLHTDPRHNMFCQLRGRKFVRLISPAERDRLYLFDDLMRQNTSQVDVESPDLATFPEFGQVQCHDFVVGLGECLFIPRGWFHHLRALEPSISVSIWFGPSKRTMAFGEEEKKKEKGSLNVQI